MFFVSKPIILSPQDLGQGRMHLRQRPVSSSNPLPSPSLENFPLPAGGEKPARK